MDSNLTPRANADLIGHAKPEAAMLGAWASGKLAHAWLITGPRGIGKATLAYRFARFILSRGRLGGAGQRGGMLSNDALPKSLYLSPKEPVFRRVAAEGHADLVSIERRADARSGKLRSEIVVDDLRGVGKFMSKTAAEGGWRLAIIDSADEMNLNAANAILKVLEEPPRGAILLLVSHNPGRLAPAVISRCRRLALRPLDEDVVANLVLRHQPETSSEDAAILARLAEGSIGCALSMAREGGLDLYRELTGLIQTLPHLDAQALHRLGERVEGKGGEEVFRVVSDLLGRWLGRLVLFGAGGKSSHACSAAEQALMQRLLDFAAVGCWIEVWEKVTHLFAHADKANLDRRQVILSAFFTLEDAVQS